MLWKKIVKEWGIGVRVGDYQSPGFIIKGLTVKMTFEEALA